MTLRRNLIINHPIECERMAFWLEKPKSNFRDLSQLQVWDILIYGYVCIGKCVGKYKGECGANGGESELWFYVGFFVFFYIWVFIPYFSSSHISWTNCPLAVGEHWLCSWNKAYHLTNLAQKKCSSCTPLLTSWSESKNGNASGPVDFCREELLLSPP